MDLHPLGDSAVVIRLGDSIDEATHRLVRAVCRRLDETPPAGIVEYVPAYATVTVHYAPERVPGERGGRAARPYQWIAAALEAVLATVGEEDLPAARLLEIPVCYGGELGPDLEEVARHHGLAADEVVSIHAGAEYLVHMIGFAPGFPYLGGLPERIATPRRPTPRARVPASSVGIGGSQTGIYPIDSPGGWHLIGRTPLRLFMPEAAGTPTLLRMGDRIRFRPIAVEEFHAHGGDG